MAINNILILGYGKMGQWFANQLRSNYNVAVTERGKVSPNGDSGLSFIDIPQKIKEFAPDLVINAVNLSATKSAFNQVMEYLPQSTILADITSIKGNMKEYYQKSGFRWVSTHPMFGPTFANMQNLQKEYAIIIEESDEEGGHFFNNFYRSFGMTIHTLPFRRHDELMAESLSLPFLATLLFSSNSHYNAMPGTTCKKHREIASGLLSEDNHLLSEVLFNEHTMEQIEGMADTLKLYAEIIRNKDSDTLFSMLDKLRNRLNSPIAERMGFGTS
ncbi:MAG: prephenate dehydrogenase/arogenate dehydrogenase family protein [Bacteroidota bacterium]